MTISKYLACVLCCYTLSFAHLAYAYQIDNNSNQTIHIYTLKNMTDAGALLVAKGWSLKSLNALSQILAVGAQIDMTVLAASWAVKIVTHFSSDAVAELVAQILSLRTHLYVTPQNSAKWSIEKMSRTLKKPVPPSFAFVIFSTADYGSINYDKLLFMGPLRSDGHYEYTEDGQMYDVERNILLPFKQPDAPRTV